nr:MAG TPA: hypothetical protein [Caudoviricetes sp.]
MIRCLLCCLGLAYVIVLFMLWGFFMSLGWALWFNEKLVSIMFIGGFITSQIYNEITKGNK